MHTRLEPLLNELEREYVHVLVHAPPILAVSGASIPARDTGATPMVARTGEYPIRELEQAMKRLAHAGVKVRGFTMNNLDMLRMGYRYGHHGNYK